LVIDRVAEIPLIFASPDPGRVFFVLPYGRDASLIGTTDTPYHGAADKARRHRGEVKELLATLFRFFLALRSDDFEKTRVRDLYWGLRPLVHHRQPSPSASREHLIVHDSAAWWSIVGVKLTAARAVGEEVALAIHKALKKQTLSK